MLGSSLLSLPDEELIRNIFVNYRKTSTGARGLRIHEEAELLLSYHFDSYKISLGELYIEKPAHTIFLDRVATMPWCLNAHGIILFEKELAMRTKMVGDLDSLIEGFDDYTNLSVTKSRR